MAYYATLLPIIAAIVQAVPVTPTQGPNTVIPSTVIKAGNDPFNRMTVPVKIGENGPYNFMIDTGSQTTILSSELANRLSLTSARTARIASIGGIGTVPTAFVDQMTLGRRSYTGVEVALLEERHMGNHGIVGVDSLQRQRVLLDFVHHRMTVDELDTRQENDDFEIVVTARSRKGQLIMTQAYLDGVRTAVIIDTGADTSVGNRALQAALSRRNTHQKTTLIDVTGHVVEAEIGFPKKLAIGTINVSNPVIAYTNTAAFDVLKLNDRPALMLGMRELRAFNRIAIDFSTRKVYFDLPDEW